MTTLLWLSVMVCLVLPILTSGAEECYPHNCIAGQATCLLNVTCKCNQSLYTWGNGDFACYKKNDVAAEIKGDQVLSTFNNNFVKFKAPLRYMLTSVKLDLIAHKRILGNCTINVHGFNKRINGKIVVDGIEVAVKLEMGYNFEKSLSLITYGQNGFVKLGGIDDDFVDSGPFGEDFQKGPIVYSSKNHSIEVQRYYNDVSRQFVFKIDSCGFRATFVPYDMTTGFQSPFIPGISVAIDTLHNPRWDNLEKVMAQPPVKYGGQTLKQLAQSLGLTIKQANYFRSFTAGVPQTQPDSSTKYSEVADVLISCKREDLARAMQYCQWLLETTSFIRCLSRDFPDTSSDAHLSLFATCVKHYCNDFSQCDALKKTPCENKQLTHILTSTCNKDYIDFRR